MPVFSTLSSTLLKLFLAPLSFIVFAQNAFSFALWRPSRKTAHHLGSLRICSTQASRFSYNPRMASAAGSTCWYIHKHLLCMQAPIPTFNHIKEFSAVGWRDELLSAWTCSGLSGSISQIWPHRKALLTKGVRWIGVDHTWNEKFMDLQPVPPSIAARRKQYQQEATGANHPTSAPSKMLIMSTHAHKPISLFMWRTVCREQR